MFRVHEFENAFKQATYRAEIKLIEYVPKTLFVKRVFGVVNTKDGLVIQIGWNEIGEAFVAGSPCPEFDLKFN